jgi:hypothetical protein
LRALYLAESDAKLAQQLDFSLVFYQRPAQFCGPSPGRLVIFQSSKSKVLVSPLTLIVVPKFVRKPGGRLAFRTSVAP